MPDSTRLITHRPALVAAILFFSGMCALVFQIAWMREFRLVFGATTAASGAVLAIFMGGLGLGNALLGRRVDKISRPLRFYALLELGIAISVAASPMLITLSRSIYVSLGGQTALGSLGAAVLRLGLSVLVLGLPTFLMGGTLPAAARAVVVPSDPKRRWVALLYGFNTLGAVLGATISTFIALEAFGTRATLWGACLVNFVLALVAYLLSGKSVAAPEDQTESNETAARDSTKLTGTDSSDGQEVNVPPFFVYLSAAVVGFGFFVMELVWFRMLGPVLGGTTFTFGLILIVALIGIGVGGAAYAFLFKNYQPTLHSFALTCGLEAVCLAYPFALGDRLATLALSLRQTSSGSFASLVLGWAVVAAIVIVPAAIVSGLQFPLLIALLGRGQRSVGRQVGNAFAWNTVGAIIGSLAGGFGILPWLSAPVTWQAVVVLLAVLAIISVALPYRFSGSRAGRLMPIVLSLVAVAALTAQGPTAAWRHSPIGSGRQDNLARGFNALRAWQNTIRRTVVWEAEGVETSVALSESNGFSLISSGKPDGNAIHDADSFIMPGLLGALLHPDPKTGLVVGLGTGETAGWLAEVDSIEHVDVVELEPAIAEVALRSHQLNFDVMNHPRVEVIYNDAREVLLTGNQQYDLIVSQPSNPYRAGVAGLFTKQYYAAARQRLSQDGIFLQWLQAYEITPETVATVFETLLSEFPHVELWQTNPADMLFVCREKPRQYPVDVLRSRIKKEPLKLALAATWRVIDLEGVLAHFIGGPKLLRDFCKKHQGNLNTDDHNHLEYSVARTVGQNMGVQLYELSLEARGIGADRPPLSGGEINWQSVEDQRIARVYAFRLPVVWRDHLDSNQRIRSDALVAFFKDDPERAVQLWESQPRPPIYPNELAALGQSYAELRNVKAEAIADQLAQISPVEAHAIRASLFWHQEKFSEATDQLVKVFTGMRTDPWAKYMEPMFDIAIGISKKDPVQAGRLIEALRQPFAGNVHDEQRRIKLCAVARAISKQQVADEIETFEPHVPWKKHFLTLRKNAYEEIGHKYTKRAQRELELYLKNDKPEAKRDTSKAQ